MRSLLIEQINIGVAHESFSHRSGLLKKSSPQFPFEQQESGGKSEDWQVRKLWARRQSRRV